MSGLYNKILVPLDGSETANQALPHGVELATSAGAELVLLRVVPNLETEVSFKSLVPTFESNVDQQQHVIDHAMSWLERISDDLGLHNIKAVSVVDVGEAAERIIDFAADEGVDLIVISTHGYTGVARWRYGSVAAKVLASATCPVLLIRARLIGESAHDQP